MTTEQIYRKYMLILIEMIKESYRTKGLKASGEFENSLEEFVNGNRIGVRGAHYAFQMENGRRPGAWSNIGAIKKWIEEKEGLPQEFKANSDRFAFLIARKHFQQGIKVPNEYNEGGVISEPVNEFVETYLPQMWEEIKQEQIIAFSSEVTQLFRAA